MLAEPQKQLSRASWVHAAVFPEAWGDFFSYMNWEVPILCSSLFFVCLFGAGSSCAHSAALFLITLIFNKDLSYTDWGATPNTHSKPSGSFLSGYIYLQVYNFKAISDKTIQRSDQTECIVKENPQHINSLKSLNYSTYTMMLWCFRTIWVLKKVYTELKIKMDHLKAKKVELLSAHQLCRRESFVVLFCISFYLWTMTFG